MVRGSVLNVRAPARLCLLWLALTAWPAPARAVPPTMDWTVTYGRTQNGHEQYVGGFTNTVTGVTWVMYRENNVEYRVRRFTATGGLLGNVLLEDTDVDFVAFAVDPAGNLVAAGTQTQPSGATDLAAASFTPAGVLSWQTPYDSTYDETASGMAVDPSGNVFVAGTFDNTGSGNADAELVSFDAAGAFRWATPLDNGDMDSGVAVAADGSGNSYLTGGTIDTSGANVAYLLACDPAGLVLFSRTYSGAAGALFGFEAGRAVAWDAWGDSVFVAADALQQIDLFKVDKATGDVLVSGASGVSFTQYRIVGGLAVDPSGAAVVTGVTGPTFFAAFDVMVQQFTPALTAGWAKAFDRGTLDAISSTNAPDHYAAAGAAIGVTGSVFVTSALTQPGCFGQGDFLVRQYGPTGATAWSVVGDGPSFDDPRGVEADAAGDAYVGGSSSAEPSLQKYAGNTGALAWARFPTLPNACVYDGAGLAASGGALYLPFAAQSQITFAETAHVAAYSAAGASGTLYTFDLIEAAIDGPVAADAAGNITMAGSFASTTTLEDDLYVVRWNPLGAVLWTRTLNAAVNDDPVGIALDPGGNTYVLETTPNLGLADDAHLVIKIDPLGNVVWTRTFSANPLMAEVSTSLAFNSGMLVVGGLEMDPATGASTGQVWRLDSSGNVVWLNGTAATPDSIVSAVRADPFGRIFATGETGDHAPFVWDEQTDSFDAAGASRWTVPFDSGRPRDFGRAVTYHAPGEIFVAGFGMSDFRLTKYTEPPQAAIAAWLSILPDTTSPGRWVQVVLTVTNGGNAAVNGLSPALELNAGFGLTYQIGGPAPVPPGPVTLAAGAVTAFTWTFSASGFGSVAFTATGAGTDASSGSPLSASSSATLLIGAAAALTGSARLVPPSTSFYIDQVFSIELTVTNTGGIPALAVWPRIVALGGSGTMATFSGPEPPGPLDLGPGSTTTFVWSFTVTGAGPMTATVYAIAWDGLSATLLAGSRVSATFYRVGALATSLQIQPAVAVTVGLPLTVILTVSNTGQVPVWGVDPILAPDFGAANVTPTGGPTPAGPVTLAGGASQRFTWTFNTIGAGSVEFSGSATGTDSGMGGTLMSSTTAVETINAQSLLVATWTMSATIVQQGKSFTERFTVSNSGGTDAWYVTPSTSVLIASGWMALQTAGPSPASRTVLAPGTSVNFTYTFRASATGYLDLTATVTGQDSATLALLTPVWATSGTVLITPAAVLRAAAAVDPPSLRVGYPFVFTLTVTNTGSADALEAIPTLSPDVAGLARIDSGPSPAAGGTIAAGASVTYTWALTSLAAGTLNLTGAISATDAGSASLATVSKSAVATAIFSPQPDGEIAVYPNPIANGTLHVYLRLEAAATKVTLDVYDASMRRVYTGEWGAVSVLDGTLDIAGVDAWAPGIYLVRAVAVLSNNTTRTFPIAKLKVKR